MVTITTAVTSAIQVVEYHVKYNTTTNLTHLKQTTCVVAGKGKPKKNCHHSHKYYLKAYSVGSC
jgi:hypothetical protein